jgi:hypothetical protein
VQLAEDSQARGHWNTAQGGAYYAVGVGGALFGRGAHVMRPRFADSIRASSPSGLREQAGHMTASDFCAARYIFSCQAGAIHT